MGKTIGIIGTGAIGSALAGYISKDLNGFVSAIKLYDADETKMKELSEKISISDVSASLEDLISSSDLVIEAASSKVVSDICKLVLKEKKDVMFMSIGGLLNEEDFIKTAREKDIKVFLPSGAIAGIDALKAFSLAGIESVVLNTSKAPRSLEGAPFIEENKIDLSLIKEKTVIFEGNAFEAMKGFPKNVNVSALLSLVGIGKNKTMVKITVDPDLSRNIHEIEINSSGGNLSIRTENVPSPENPKTSYLAALAAMASVKGYFDSVHMGT